MTDLDQTGSAEPTAQPDSSEGVGKSITQSFKNRMQRVKNETTPAETASAEESTLDAGVLAALESVPSGPPVPSFEAPVPPAEPETHLNPFTEPVTLPDPAIVPAQPATAPVKAPRPPRPPKPAVERAPREPKPRSTGPARRARLRISRVDPWSVMKTSLLFGVAAWIISIVAVWVVFTVLDTTGLYNSINDVVSQIFASDGQATFNIKDYINTTRATALAALVGAVNVVIVTALATTFAFLYNLSALVMGGIEVTMAED
ncbi:MAG: DUF3566 domain-containing protein [Propionibacteriaceae bacterium]|jgi:hypothetical protein|nr:DUF3566 domain-containing protein [Propionibacteriaceae bacterium]